MQSQNSIISFLQAFGILLVVVGHSFYGCPDNPIHTWIYSFHMPLFMFISGYLLKYTMSIKGNQLTEIPLYGQGGFITKKIERLLTPYFLISSWAFILKILLNRFSASPVDLSFTYYGKMLLYPWSNIIIYFWFLPTLFLIFMIVVYGKRIMKYIKWKIPAWSILCMLLLLHIFNPLSEVSLLNISGVIGYLVYFAFGYYFYWSNIEHKLSSSLITASITFILSIIFLYLPFFKGKDVLTAFNGILMSISLSQLYITHNWKFFHHLFGASYAIYLFSWFPQVLSQRIFLNIIHAPWPIESCMSILSGIYIPLWIYKWIVKNKNKKWGKAIAKLTGQ